MAPKATCLQGASPAEGPAPHAPIVPAAGSAPARVARCPRRSPRMLALVLALVVALGAAPLTAQAAMDIYLRDMNGNVISDGSEVDLDLLNRGFIFCKGPNYDVPGERALVFRIDDSGGDASFDVGSMWLTENLETYFGPFVFQPGHTYSFYVRALDDSNYLGNVIATATVSFKIAGGEPSGIGGAIESGDYSDGTTGSTSDGTPSAGSEGGQGSEQGTGTDAAQQEQDRTGADNGPAAAEGSRDPSEGGESALERLARTAQSAFQPSASPMKQPAQGELDMSLAVTGAVLSEKGTVYQLNAATDGQGGEDAQDDSLANLMINLVGLPLAMVVLVAALLLAAPAGAAARAASMQVGLRMPTRLVA